MKTLTFLASFLMLATTLLANTPTKKSESIAASLKPLEIKTSQRYSYLRATQRDCHLGDTYLYSSVIAIDAQTWNMNREEVIDAFMEQLHDKYPLSTFDVSIESVRGVFTTQEAAERNKKVCMSEKKVEAHNIEEIVLDTNIQ